MNLVNQSIIKHKMGLLNLAEELRNVSQACRVMGVSRDTFYRVKEAKETGGLEALLHKDWRRANLKNRVDEAVEAAVLAFALENPAAGQVRVSNELRKRNVHVSPTGVRSVWLRHGLQTFRLRLAALETKVAEDGLLLTEVGLESSAIGNLVERTTRYTLLLHLPPMPEHGRFPRARNGPALAGHGAKPFAMRSRASWPHSPSNSVDR